MKKKMFISLFLSAVVSGGFAAAMIGSADFDFTAQEIGLVAGLNPGDLQEAVNGLQKGTRTALQELRMIADNVEAYYDPENFGNDIYAGCYFENAREDPQLYICLTDLSAAQEIDHPRVHYRKVKYTRTQLYAFRAVVRIYYADRYFEMGSSTKDNRITITFKTGTDLTVLQQLLPEDSYAYTFAEKSDFQLLSSSAESGLTP